MSEKADVVSIQGTSLVCPICKHDQFFSQQTLVSPPVTAFLGHALVNKTATIRICAKCDHVLWFLDKWSR